MFFEGLLHVSISYTYILGEMLQKFKKLLKIGQF